MIIKSIPKDKWVDLKRETHNTIVYILEAVETLRDHITANVQLSASEIMMCAGLYSHAVEEYGKLIYLKSLSPKPDGNVDIEFGNRRSPGKFDNHKHKFELAIATLPPQCTTLHSGAFTRDSYSRESHDVDTISDWETRLTIFNTDFREDGTVKRYPTVDVENLRTAITEFRNIVNTTSPI
ncbi:MAG: hypothetical protein KGI25_03695 [Thaumarchaeota archaeon]|nr:hypothetical protein [Nitrososphaerota archaeon]